MDTDDSIKSNRRAFIVATVAGAALGCLSLTGRAAGGQATNTKIGIIGTGKIGGTLAELWVKAGYEVMVSSRHPDQLKELVQRLGPRARVGTPQEAAAFGDVILISVPYGALPQVGRDYAKELKGKIVLDTGNPYPARDGDMANEARQKGTGLASAEFLPGVRLVRAFNSIPHTSLRSEAHRQGERVAVALASDNPEALKLASRLVEDAGFDPVVVGPLSRAKEFDVGTAVYGKAITAREMRQGLGIAQ
jgi:8-hydroxy-5-deazaflavin:NADPH oxidoreductase